MRTLAIAISMAALAGTIVPALMFFNGNMTLDRMQYWMLVATFGWFATAPLWMDRES